MNDLNLRISGGIGEKVKKPAAPISMPYWSSEMSGAVGEFSITFLNSNSADNQLKLLKQFLNSHKAEWNEETIKFLVLLFWHADAKHPVKGFLKKHITDSRTLRQPFTEGLTSVITTAIEDSSTLLYGDYIGTITRLDACIDKFPPGATVINTVEIAVTTYLVHCLESCIRTLGVTGENNHCAVNKPEPLAPTEINKIYDLVHLTLRLLLYMIQKVTDDNQGKLSSMFESIRHIIAELMLGKEVPMDTKSVSGIVYLTLHLFENGPESWIALLEADRSSQNGTVNLSVYSAVATVVPAAELMAAEVKGQPAVLDLTDKILALGDRYSSDSSHILAVARTVLAISKGTVGTSAALAARLARFCWGHMDHHMDSVRHLAAQVMGHVVRTSVGLQRQGDPSALDELFTSLSTLDTTRKSYYVTLTALAEELGGGLLARRPDVIRDVIAALRTQAVQACATTFLETLLKKHMAGSDTETIYRQWIRVILDAVRRESEPAVLHVLEGVLARAVRGDSAVLRHILPEERALTSYVGSDLKCILLVLGVVRKSGVDYKRVSFSELMHTAYDADDEVRVLALSLVAETPRSTEPLSADELLFVLHFLDYNANAQAPSFLQLVLALMKKILKRLEDSYKVLLRRATEHEAEIASYLRFAEELRQQCFSSLALGGSYGRRRSALQLLRWLQDLQLAEWGRTWTEEQADIMYNLLEDSYEDNKAFALDILKDCPVELIKPVQSAGLQAALAQASGARPADCASAVYKLRLLRALPLDCGPSHLERDIPEQKCFVLLMRILEELKTQAARAQDIVRAARDAPMHGLARGLAGLLAGLDAKAIAGNEQWSALVADMIATCEVVNARVASVVNAASPEGLLPEELVDQVDSSGGARLADGRCVSAQMLLLCAWRSVKETSLLLGCISSRLTIEGEDPAWTLSAQQMEDIGEHFIELLSKVKHRGAFEQAYVGFTQLLGRLWKCRSPRLHQLPLRWFDVAARGVTAGAGGAGAGVGAGAGAGHAGDAGPSRRAAGLPFMIQALVTTELAVEPTAPRGRLLARALELCLRVAGAPGAGGPGAEGPGAEGPGPGGPGARARAHLVLRALVRHAVLPAAPTAEAIMVAIRGFEADTWMERNTSTLLFSALAVRVFGVPRARDPRACTRNRMTGRVFFLRYPQLFDFLLEQLESASPESPLRPALFPTLLLLARLYPSALEGTVSNLKLARFLPSLVCVAGARDAGARSRAARAPSPLLPPHRYMAHLQSLFVSLGDPAIKRNLCHGLLCQVVSVLLEMKPDLAVDSPGRAALLQAARGTRWLAAQAAGPAPCYPVADEWLTVLNLMLLRFPKLLDDELSSISTYLETALFAPTPLITSGREVFLSNAVYMLLIIATTLNTPITPLVMRYLQHPDYEVNLSILNYLLVLHGYNEELCQFLRHLSQISNKDVLKELERDGNYVKFLCDVTGNGYLECKQKALRVLVASGDTQRDIVKLKLEKDVEFSDEVVMMVLIDCVRNGHASLSSIYLDSLLNMVSKLGASLEVVRVLHECSAAGNEEGARGAVAGFLQTQLGALMGTAPSDDQAEMFEWTATLTATVAILLEDDACSVRQRAALAVQDALDAAPAALDAAPAALDAAPAALDAAPAALDAAPAALDAAPAAPALAAHAARAWRRASAALAQAPALLLLLAALDFRADVDSGDELGEEYRVFDHNETHNVYLEECTWTRDCALEIKRIYKQTYTDTHTINEFLHSLIYDPIYKDTIEKLCIENVAECLTGRIKSINPKIDLFLKILKE